MKTIVTHIGPDLDAITAIWLVKTRFPGWQEAALAFVPAGETLGKLPPDDNPEVIHVDTGFGKYDHHQVDDNTCASIRVYKEIKSISSSDPALERLITVVNDIDHFREAFFPNPTSDYWDFGLVASIDGWRLLYPDDPTIVVHYGMDALDGIYKTFQNKIWAEEELTIKGVEFETKWGKGIGVETTNDEVVHLGQKKGYVLVIRKDPKKHYLRVKALPQPNIDLSDAFDSMKAKDPDATWFLHVSKHMILNGSSKNPSMRPTKLTIDEIISILKE